MRTSQLAIPQEACEAGVRHAGYEQSVQTSPSSRSTPTWSSPTATSSQLATATGEPGRGYALTLNVGV